MVIAIDPVPPPTDQNIVKGLDKKDFEVLAAVGRHKNKYYLLGYQMRRGHTPEWTAATFISMCLQYKPVRVVIETTQYQSTLKWLLEQAMQKTGAYFVMEGFDEKIKKYHLIFQAFSSFATERNFYVQPGHTEFLEQYQSYPYTGGKDDVVNAVALAIRKLQEIGDISADMASLEEEKNITPLQGFRSAP